MKFWVIFYLPCSLQTPGGLSWRPVFCLFTKTYVSNYCALYCFREQIIVSCRRKKIHGPILITRKYFETDKQVTDHWKNIVPLKYLIWRIYYSFRIYFFNLTLYGFFLVESNLCLTDKAVGLHFRPSNFKGHRSLLWPLIERLIAIVGYQIDFSNFKMKPVRFSNFSQ